MVLHSHGTFNLFGEEIAGPHGLSVRLDELMPGAVSAIGLGVEPMSAHDVSNRGARDPFAQAELAQFSMNACFTPMIEFVLGCQADDQLLNGFRRDGAAATVLLGPSCRCVLGFPCQAFQGVVGDDHDEIIRVFTKVLLGSQQFSALPRRDPNDRWPKFNKIISHQSESTAISCLFPTVIRVRSPE